MLEGTGPQRWSDLPGITELVRGKVRIDPWPASRATCLNHLCFLLIKDGIEVTFGRGLLVFLADVAFSVPSLLADWRVPSAD